MKPTFELKARQPLRGSRSWDVRREEHRGERRALGYNGSRANVLTGDDTTPYEKLAMAIIQQAAKDLTDPRVSDSHYSSAVHFFAEPSPLYDVFAHHLGLSDFFLERVRGVVNGREVKPLQRFLW